MSGCTAKLLFASSVCFHGAAEAAAVLVLAGATTGALAFTSRALRAVGITATVVARWTDVLSINVRCVDECGAVNKCQSMHIQARGKLFGAGPTPSNVLEQHRHDAQFQRQAAFAHL